MTTEQFQKKVQEWTNDNPTHAMWKIEYVANLKESACIRVWKSIDYQIDDNPVKMDLHCNYTVRADEESLRMAVRTINEKLSAITNKLFDK